MKETSTDNESKIDLRELNKQRQLFRLHPFTKLIFPQHNITHWEQLTCAGYNPYYQRLEAIVSIKQPTGYNGTLCSNGSKETVRFFVDFKDGAGFQDMGYTSFKVADISDNPPGPQHPLSYAAFLFIDDTKHRKFLDCDTAVIPTLRAVLSWNSIPSVNPFHDPFYGNHIDADIQLARKPKISWRDIVEVNKIKDFAKMIDPELQITFKDPATEKAENIYKINQAAEVAVQRTFYSTIGSKINSTVDFSKANAIFDIVSFDAFNIDLISFYDFFNIDGKKADTSFEELTCVGLNTLTDRLSAVIHIKKPKGFNGNLCSKGSMEHVAFWADWDNNGTFDQYVGTVSLNVHDIHNIPGNGLYYTVQLPINVSDRLKKCSTPNIIRIRAVLSWESLPSTTNPNLLNHWGNYKDVLVQVRPVFQPGSGLHSAIHYVGGVDRLSISPLTYLHSAGPVDQNNNRPWGGRINFNGIIDRNGFGGIIKYRFLVKPRTALDIPTSWTPVSTSEAFRLDDIFTAAGPFTDVQADPNGWYIYKQNPNIGLYNTTNYLAGWSSSTWTDGEYTIRFVHTNEFGVEVNADEFTIVVCNKGMQVSPSANVHVDMTKDLDLVIDGGDCHSYTLRVPMIHGHVRAVHPFFANWQLELQPTSHTNGVNPSPLERTIIVTSSNGDSDEVWQLDTTDLDPCGYTVSLSAHTRVILDSNPGNLPYYGPKAVGFAKLP